MTRQIKVLLMAATLIVMSSCGGSGGVSPSSGGSNGASPNISAGNWALVATSQILHGYIASAGGNLTSSGSNVTMTANTSAGCTLSLLPVLFSGSMNGDSITLTSAKLWEGNIVEVTGTVYNGTNIGGTYQSTGGTGKCNGDVGTVYATLVPSISGNWSGTSGQFIDSNGEPVLDSNANPVSPVITASISQADTASANGSFPLSGTMTFTNPPPTVPPAVDPPVCFTSGTIDPTLSSIAGGAVTMVVDVDGGATVTFTGTNLLNPNTAVGMSLGYIVSGGACDQYSATGGTLNKS